MGWSIIDHLNVLGQYTGCSGSIKSKLNTAINVVKKKLIRGKFSVVKMKLTLENLLQQSLKKKETPLDWLKEG